MTAGPAYRFPVEAGHILTFARALGDPNPVYCDPAYARSEGFADVLAPPTFYEASAHFDPHSEVRPHPGQPWFGSAGQPTGDPGREERNPGTTLHAETHVTYHRHAWAGEVLEVRHRPGSQWTKSGQRGGDLSFHDWYVDYHDESGEVALTARTVAVTTAQKLPPPTRPEEGDTAGSRPPELDEVGAGGDAAGGGRPGPARASELAMGYTHAAVLVRDLRRVQIIQYAGASGDFSPQHTDEVYNTRVAGYPTVFAHGMLTMGMTGRMLTDWLGDGRLAGFGLRFLAPVWPGDDLVARATVETIDLRAEPLVEVAVETVNQRDEPVVRGYATARLDP